MANTHELLKDIDSLIQGCLDRCRNHPHDVHIANSGWSLYQHLEHLAITGRSTPKFIQDALKGLCNKPLNDNGKLLFNLGSIPRGKTKAPDFALPKGLLRSKIEQGFVRMKVAIEDLRNFAESIDQHSGRSEHPQLGGLTAQEWLIFLRMHLKHHLDILG
jgi:hypothetical protein